MDKFVGAIGLIRHPIDVERRWLALWDENRSWFDFAVAQRLTGESYRESLDREIAWRFPLRRGKDYLISSVARIHLDTALLIDEQANPTLFSVEMFVVDLFGKRAAPQIEDDANTLWLTCNELLAGKTDCGRQISPQLVLLLGKADVFPPQHRH